MTGRSPSLPAAWRRRLGAVALGAALALPISAPGQGELTLLRPGASSYAASGSYGLSLSRDWADLSFGIFAPNTVRDGQGRFTDLAFSATGNSDAQTLRFSLGQSWRQVLPGGEVLGLNTYLDLGKQAERSDMMGQLGLGVEYERAMSGMLRDNRLSFGSNLYLPFTDYTDPRFSGAGDVPRPGIDGYLSWAHGFGSGLELGGRLSLFHYPATASRDARGIGTLSLTGRMTRHLPPGSAIEATLGSRYEHGRAPVPSLSLNYSRAIPHPGAGAAAPIGALRPAAKCRIVPGDRRLDRLDCGRSSYDPARPHEVYGPDGVDPDVAVTVPPPQRYLGYGTLFVP